MLKTDSHHGLKNFHGRQLISNFHFDTIIIIRYFLVFEIINPEAPGKIDPRGLRSAQKSFQIDFLV